MDRKKNRKNRKVILWDKFLTKQEKTKTTIGTRIENQQKKRDEDIRAQNTSNRNVPLQH